MRKVHKLLELFTQSKLGDNESTGDAEEYAKKQSPEVLYLSVLFLHC